MVESGISLDDVRSRIGFDAEVESIACKCAPDLPDNVVSGDLARFHLSESGLKLTVHRQPGRVSEERRIEASVPERWRRFQTVRGESLIAWTEPPARAGYVRRVLNEVFSPEEIARPIRIFLFSGIPLIGGYVLGLADVLGNVARSLGR